MNLGYETEQIEFKKTTAELKEGIISLASMLNKHGAAKLYFGVENNGDVRGQQIGENTLRDISQAIANSIKPQVIPSISAELYENKTIILVTVVGNQKPYSAYGKYYIRSADEDREISPSQLRELMTAQTSDAIVNIESNEQVLSFSQLKTMYLEQGFTLRDDTFLHNLHLLTKDGKYNLMANILSDSNSFSIKVARFQGKDKTKLIKRNEYGYKCLLLAIKQVLDYAEALNETTVELVGAQRKETKLFDFACFREAWLNACLHNKWSRLTPPAVYFFDDRIEIISTGGLPVDYSQDDFFNGRSRPVNLELQQIMVQLQFIEQTGHGVPLIVSKYGKQAFDLSDNFITVTIPLNRKNATVNATINATVKLTELQKQIIDLLKSSPNITYTEIATELSKDRVTISRNLKKLKELGIVERIGTDKSGYWKVNPVQPN